VDKDIYHIASDYFSGRISERDFDALQEWLAQSPEHKLLLEELEKVWKLTGKLSFDMSPDVDMEWERFVQDRDNPVSNELFKSSRQIGFTWYLRIAAVLIPVALILSIGYFFLKNKNIQANQIAIHAGNEKKICILSDGTQVWINRQSSITYPSKFSDSERVVQLEGEAYFDVVKGKGTFKIITGKTAVVVLGTAFNVRAYQQEKFTEVIVSRGKVLFEEKSLHQQKTLLLAGDQGTFDEASKKITKKIVGDSNLLGWKDDKLSFHNAPLNEIQFILKRYFNVPMQFSPSMLQCRFTGDFHKPALDEVLKVMTVTLGASYSIKNDTIFLNGKGCEK
jgi:transmembrane sensor